MRWIYKCKFKCNRSELYCLLLVSLQHLYVYFISAAMMAQPQDFLVELIRLCCNVCGSNHCLTFFFQNPFQSICQSHSNTNHNPFGLY